MPISRSQALSIYNRAYGASRRRRQTRRRRPVVARFKRKYQPSATWKNKLMTGMPAKLKTVIRFAINDNSTHGLTSTAGGVSADFIYKANGLYDPYAGVGGLQGRYFDQMMALYRHFTVIGSKIRLDLLFDDYAGAQAPFRVSCILTDYATAITNAGLLTEDPRSTSRCLSSAHGPQRLINSFSARKYFSVKNPMDDATLAGTSAADPSNTAYFHVLGNDPTGHTQTCQFTGFIDYIVIFHDPLTPAQS